MTSVTTTPDTEASAPNPASTTVEAAEPDVVAHGYADAFDPTPEPVLTKLEARTQAAALEDPQAIMALNYPNKEYLNTLYWRRIRLDSTKGAANRHISGSKAARRRSSLSPEAIQRRLTAAEGRVAERQAAVDGLDGEIAAIDDELEAANATLAADMTAVETHLAAVLEKAEIDTGSAYQKHVIHAERDLFPNLTAINPVGIKGRLDAYKSALGLFAADARAAAAVYETAVTNAAAHQEHRRRDATIRKAQLNRQRDKLVGDRVRRAGALAKAQGKRNQAAELAARLTENAEAASV